jgi:CRISPR-associated protein Cas5d
MDYDTPVAVKVWGDFACFTRPEMKVERVTYPLMTPSAARGVLEAIFWKPEFTWLVERIWVLNEIRYFSILRNEVNHRVPERSAREWSEWGGYIASHRDNRSQRHTLALRDVAYVIQARPKPKPGASDSAKFRDQFRRRVARGQCYSRPYLGCREFAASFAPPTGNEQPVELSVDFGRMLLDLDFAPDRSGRAVPRFFEARLEKGILRVPHVDIGGGR